MGMIVAPCSIRTLSEIASGVTSSLLTRAADVVLKERRKLMLMVRETPLHLGHLRAMTQVTEIGAIVIPPVPAFYARPTSRARARSVRPGRRSGSALGRDDRRSDHRATPTKPIKAFTHYSLQVAQDVAPERVDMGTHRVLGSLDVTVADRLENLVVLIVDAALMIRRGQRNEPQPQ
jgi:hypothetical protein